MSKFKIGDVVRRTGEDCSNVRKGMTYTVSGLSDAGDTLYLGFGDNGYHSYNFELVQAEPEYLTPEQVLKALQDDPTKVEVQYGISGEFISADTVHPITYVDITQGKWRFKQVPKTIDYYGTELPKPIAKAEATARGYRFGYIPTLSSNTVNRIELKYLRDEVRYLYTTEVEAQLVLDTMTKPFKQ